MATPPSRRVIDEPGALAGEIVINVVQDVPQFAGRHGHRPIAALSPVVAHEITNAPNRDLGILGFAVPDTPSAGARPARRSPLSRGPVAAGQSTVHSLLAWRAAAAWQCGTNRRLAAS